MLGNGEEGLSLLSSLFFLSSILFRHNSVLIYPHHIQSVLTIRNYSGTTGTTMYVFSRATIILYPSDIKPTLVSFALIAV